MVDPNRAWLKSYLKLLRWVFLAFYLALMVGLSTFLRTYDSVAWLWLLGIMVLSQVLFVLGASTIQLGWPIARRRLWISVTVAAFNLAVLVMGMVCCNMEFNQDLLHKLGWYGLAEETFWSIFGASWLGSGLVLWALVKRWPRLTVLRRLTVLLFAGSLAELLSAVPSHLIVVEQRSGWLVGISTMIGVVAGVYVVVFTLGAAILQMFLRPGNRMERMEEFESAFLADREQEGFIMSASPKNK